MEIIYLIATIIGIVVVLPIIGFIMIVVIGFVTRFWDILPTLSRRTYSPKSGDSMRILEGGETFDDY
ncbi:MAG: hypothetical protein Kow0031_28170 [Anaerolineae bacterium]